MLSGPNHAEEVARDFPTASVVASAPTSSWRGPLAGAISSPAAAGLRLARRGRRRAVRRGQERDGAGRRDLGRARLRRQRQGRHHHPRDGRDVPAGRGLRGRGERRTSGMAGMGDLVATCTSRHSRNRRAGELLAQGVPGGLDRVRDRPGRRGPDHRAGAARRCGRGGASSCRSPRRSAPSPSTARDPLDALAELMAQRANRGVSLRRSRSSTISADEPFELDTPASFCSRPSRSPRATPTRSPTRSPTACSTRCCGSDPPAASPARCWSRPGWSSSPARSPPRPTSTSPASSATRCSDIGYTSAVLRLRRPDLRGDGRARRAVAGHRPGRRLVLRAAARPAAPTSTAGRRRPGHDVRLRLRRDARADADADHARARASPAAWPRCARTGTLDYLRPDGKAQVTVRYRSDGGRLVPVAVERLLVSTQHDPDVDIAQIKRRRHRARAAPVLPSRCAPRGGSTSPTSCS